MKKKCILLILLAALLLTACGKDDDGPVKTIILPENGIVSAAELENARKNESVLYITGGSGDYQYQWALFGTRITNPKDTDFTVSVSKQRDGEYIVKLNDKPNFSASLSFRINGQTEGDTAAVYDLNGNRLDEASVMQYSSYTDLCFYVLPDIDSYSIIVDPVEKTPDIQENTESGSDAQTGVSEAVSSANVSSDASAASKPNQTGKAAAADYLSPVGSGDELKTASGSAVVSGGKAQDKYHTDPVPEGKPHPVEPENQTITEENGTCTFSISCATILDNMDLCDPEKAELVPDDGWILRPVSVSFKKGESVFDVLQRVCRSYGIHMEFEWTPMYNSAYIEGIQNLYEFDVGNLSGWMYKVNGWFPNYGCSRYALQNGDTVDWCYTCDLGYDVGGGYAVGG